jgi:hypothetical protein
VTAADTTSTTDAVMTDAPAPAPFTMMTGDPAAMVCEGDVCYVPGTPAAE